MINANLTLIKEYYKEDSLALKKEELGLDIDKYNYL